MRKRLIALADSRDFLMMELIHTGFDDLDLVIMVGRLDAAEKSRATATLVAILEGGTGVMHLEMSRLEFVDSSGLSVLVSLLKRARKQDGDIILYNVNGLVKSLFELTCLHEIFEMREDDSLAQASGM